MILAGRKNYNEIPTFIAASNICILPACPDEIIMQEIVPIKLYEYMAMGKPVITTMLPGVMKEFGYDNGISYIQKPSDVLKKSYSIDLVNESKKARRFAEANDWIKITDEFDTAYISKVTDLKKDIKKSLEFIGWKERVKSDSTVFIKPNFTYPYFKEGVTTSPEFLKCIMEILKDRADNVILGESDGGYHSFTAADAFNGHNMTNICKETGVELVNLSELPSKRVDGNIDGKNVSVELPQLLLNDVDCFMSVPVLKVHVMTRVTLSMKNLWGCYPDTMRCLHHKNLNQKLTLITKTLNPQIILMDAKYALDGHGPMYGEAKRLDMILASNNPVVIDALGTAVMGIPLKSVEHILVAEREGLGITNLEKIKINDNWKKFEMKFNSNKTFMDNLSTLLFKSETIAKIVMDSPATPLIYGIAKHLRNSDEKTVVKELEKY